MMLVALHGDEMLEAITLRSLQTGEDTSVETRWLFICIGGAPRTEWAEELDVIRDSGAYLVTGSELLINASKPERWPLDREPFHFGNECSGRFCRRRRKT